MTDRIVGGLRTQATVESRVESGAAPAWVRAHWNSFREGLLGERNDAPFPCFFGAESVAKGDPLYTAVPSMTDKDALLGLGETLLEYLEVRTDHSDRASLVAFFRPPDRELTEAEYHDALWHVLQFLHVHDTEAGQHARDVIQGRLESYDGVCPHADLGDWGVEGDREWPQYMLASDDAQAPSSCPITVSREHPKSERLLADRRAGSHG